MALVVAVLVLAGCADDGPEDPPGGPDGQVTDAGEPDDSTTEPVEPEPEPYPVPERPEAMDNDDIDGAEAAAIYFLELFPYMYATGDLEPWEAMSGASCGFCSGTRDEVAELFSSGGSAEAAPLEFQSISSGIQADTASDYWVETAFISPSIREFDERGELANESPLEEVTAWLLLEQSSSDWRVVGVEVEARDL